MKLSRDESALIKRSMDCYGFILIVGDMKDSYINIGLQNRMQRNRCNATDRHCDRVAHFSTEHAKVLSAQSVTINASGKRKEREKDVPIGR